MWDEEIARRLVREQALVRIGRALANEIDLGRVADVAMEQSVGYLGVDGASIWLKHPIQPELSLLTMYPSNALVTNRVISFDAPFITSMAARTQKVQIIEDLAECQDFLLAVQLPGNTAIRGLAAVPLFARGHLIGVASYVTQDPRHFTADDIEFNCTVADFLAVAIENARLHRNLRDRERQVDVLLKATIDAQEQERRRICLEVHDGLAQTLATTSHYLEALDGHPDLAENLRTHVVTASTLVHRAVQEAREVIATLRPAALDNLGLVETLRCELADIRARTGLQIDLDADSTRLPDEIETALYRIMGEAINNIVKHARARKIIIRLAKDKLGNVVASIADDGIGFNPSDTWNRVRPQGMGLLSVRKRAELLGGAFTIESGSGEGTKLSVEIPLLVPRQMNDFFDNPIQLVPEADISTAEGDGDPITVLIVDDHLLARQGLRVMLDQNKSLRIVGEANDGLEALDLVDRLHPRVVLMDLRMPNLDGLEATRQIKQKHPNTAVIVMTNYEDNALVAGALQAGAGGYLLKDASRELLIHTIGAVISGGTLIKAPLLLQAISGLTLAGQPQSVDPKKLADMHKLTEREQEVLRLLAEGWTNRDIGRNLVITEGTVKKHVQSIISKLGASDRTHAAILALRAGLIV